MSSAPIVDRIRIIPRPNDFLDRNVGSSGEVFFDSETSSLRLYSGKLAGGFEVLTNKSLSGIATKTYDVTIVGPQGSDVGNKYTLNGEYKPSLSFVIGYTYIFNQNDSTNVWFPNAVDTTNNQNPLNFSADDPNGENGSGTVYTDRVVYKLDYKVVSKQGYWDGFQNAEQRSVSITITDQTPTTLYYWCQNHLNMGNTIVTADPGTGSGGSTDVSDTAPTTPESGSIWYNSTNGRLYVYVVDDDSGQWVQPSTTSVSSLLDIGISDGTIGQVLTTDGAGNFTFQDSSSIGNFTLSNSVIDTDDSSGISFVPPVTMNSDLTVENDVIVSNKISATSFINTGTGTASIDSATTITLQAPDGVLVEGELKLQNNNITGVPTIDATTINASSITASQAVFTGIVTFGTSDATGTHNIILANNSNNFAFQHNKFLSGEEVQYGRFNAGAKTALQFGTTTGGDTGQIFNSALSYISTTGFNFGDNNLNGYPLPYKMGVLDMTGATPSWTGGGESGIADNGNGDATITFSEDIASSTENFQVMATIQDQTTGHMVTISKPGVADIRVKVENGPPGGGNGVDAKVFLIIYKVT